MNCHQLLNTGDSLSDLNLASTDSLGSGTMHQLPSGMFPECWRGSR